MSEHPNNPQPQHRENPEPQEARHPIPYLLLAMIAMLLSWALGYLMAARPDADPALGDQRTLAKLTGEPSLASSSNSAPDGAQLYASHCQACHQSTGMGIPHVFPPLAGSQWVQGDARVLLQIPLHGIAGALDVAGQQYSGSMPAMGGQLDDAELAAIANYIRSHWGNTAEPVDVESVAAARTLTKDRSTPWNGGAELQQFTQSLAGN